MILTIWRDIASNYYYYITNFSIRNKGNKYLSYWAHNKLGSSSLFSFFSRFYLFFLKLKFENIWRKFCFTLFLLLFFINKFIHPDDNLPYHHLNYPPLIHSQLSILPGFVHLTEPLLQPHARVFYTLSYSSHNQFLAKRELNLGSPRFEPMTIPMSNSMHNHSIISCFMMINTIIWFYYHSHDSSRLLE